MRIEASALCIAAAALLAAAALPADAAASAGSYASATIIAPEQDAAVRNNAGNLTVTVQVLPSLQKGHLVQILLDGVPQGEPQPTLQVALTNLDRGTHALQARIVDAGGNVVFTGAASTFHLLRHSRLHP